MFLLLVVPCTSSGASLDLNSLLGSTFNGGLLEVN